MADNTPELIFPDWNAPDNVHAVFTTRVGGYSQSEFAAFNLGLHVNDLPEHVESNRTLLIQTLKLPSAPKYLNQVHGTGVIEANDVIPGSPQNADACWTERNDTVITIMTADCLPVLFVSRCGQAIAGAHAGWRGLANGVLEATIKTMPVAPDELLAWLGPAIGPKHFEVGAEVRECFTQQSAKSDRHFEQQSSQKYLANLYGLASDRLNDAGITSISGGSHCTYAQDDLFFSHRRDRGKTGRMAALIWKT